MKKATWFGLAAAAVLGTGIARGEDVGREIAQLVAENQVAVFFPEEGWRVADGVEVKDGEGGTAAWAFVFANEGFGGEDVRGRVAAGEDGSDGESDLYAGTATVVTGGRDTDSLVFRIFRGLADWYQEGARGGWKGEAVRVGPGDIRWAPDAPAGAKGPGKGAAVRRAAAARKAAEGEEREGWNAERREAEAEAQAEAEAAAKARWAGAKDMVLRAE